MRGSSISKFKWLIFSGAAFMLLTAALAEEPEDEVTESSEEASKTTPETASTEPAPKRAKGRPGSEKDTEGTKAPNRFEADSVIKSRYHLNGEPLEVDPD